MKGVHIVIYFFNRPISSNYVKKTDYILYTQDQKQLFVIVHSKNRDYEFGILMMQNTEDNRDRWCRYIDNQ